MALPGLMRLCRDHRLLQQRETKRTAAGGGGGGGDGADEGLLTRAQVRRLFLATCSGRGSSQLLGGDALPMLVSGEFTECLLRMALFMFASPAGAPPLAAAAADTAADKVAALLSHIVRAASKTAPWRLVPT